jgi:hypothetical protein
MASKDTECKMINLQFAIARLLVYAKKNKNPCFSDIDVLEEEIKEELKKENIQVRFCLHMTSVISVFYDKAQIISKLPIV